METQGNSCKNEDEADRQIGRRHLEKRDYDLFST